MLLGTGWPFSASTLEIPKKHYGTVVLPGTGAPCCFSSLRDWICRFVLFLVFLYFGFWDVFGCDVGHLKALALIPIDVYVGGK